MDKLNDWLWKVSEGRIDRTLQSDIADRVLELLEQKKGLLDTREKILFSGAVTALSASVNSIYQPNESGLRRCLTLLQMLMSPESDPEIYSERDDEADRVNYAILITTVKVIRGELAKHG